MEAVAPALEGLVVGVDMDNGAPVVEMCRSISPLTSSSCPLSSLLESESLESSSSLPSLLLLVETLRLAFFRLTNFCFFFPPPPPLVVLPSPFFPLPL